MKEVEALGFRLTAKPSAGASPYGVISGRSNQRWWLFPLSDARLSISGMSMFQPTLVSARFLKAGAAIASSLGLSSIWSRNRIYLSGISALNTYFGDIQGHYAFFTGTESPHRKLAVQVMDHAGNIKGYAKVSRNPLVKPLLKSEAFWLRHLSTLGVQSADVPTLLYEGEAAGVSVLLTDTLRSRRSRTVTSLGSAHLRFLDELQRKSVQKNFAQRPSAAKNLEEDVSKLADRLPTDWHLRLREAIKRLSRSTIQPRPLGLSHGDFTPSNTFFGNGRLYVFDWELAGYEYPLGYDLIHFILSDPAVKNQPVSQTIRYVIRKAVDAYFLPCEADAVSLVLAYFCRRSITYAAREASTKFQPLVEWDGSQRDAVALDALLSGNY